MAREAVSVSAHASSSHVIYSQQNCERRHKSYRTAANCIWRRHLLTGDGRYALMEKFWCRCCGHTAQIHLYKEKAPAEKELASLNDIHATGKCCGSCTRSARIIELAASLAPRAPAPPERRAAE